MSDYKQYKHGVSITEQSQESDFDQLIRDALGQDNFKLAIRYLYLKSLISLAKQGLLSLKDWKSPFDYQRELKGEKASLYREMSVLFEYVWYGDFEATQSDYERGESLTHQLEGVK